MRRNTDNSIRSGFWRSDMFGPQTKWIVALIAITVCCVGIMAIGAGAVALGNRNQATNVIKVPGDYSTIQAAITAAKDGDIIQVRTGVYNESITLNKAVSLIAESFDQINPTNNKTIIDGKGGAAAVVIPAGLTQIPTVRGFLIRNSGDGMQVNSPAIAEYNYFLSTKISVNYQMGGGGTNRNNVYFGSSDDAIHIDSLTRPLLIESNRIMYSGDDGIEFNLQNTNVPPAPVELDIWNNMIIGSHEDGVQLIDYPGNPQDTNHRIIFWGNLIAASVKAGIGLMPNGNSVEDYSGADLVEPVRVINNTFYGNERGISGGDNLVAINNIIDSSITRGVWRVQGPPGANSVIAYTLFHNNAMDQEESTLGPGIITGQDPLFLAAPNPGQDGKWQTVDDDFSGLVLQPGSPAIDKGVVQYGAANGELVPSSPIHGFVGAAPDLGWREFGSPAFITPTPLVTLAQTNTPVSPTATVPTATPITITPIVVTATPGPSSPTPTNSPLAPTSTVPASATFTSQPSATLTTIPATPTISATATLAPLAVTGVNPISAQANTTITLTVTGTGFVPGSAISFEGGQGVASEVVSVQVVNSTTITAIVNVKADASFGAQAWDVRVTNPDTTSAVMLDAFTVIP